MKVPIIHIKGTIQLWPQVQSYNSHSLQKDTPSIYQKYACLSFLIGNLVLAQCELYIVLLFPVFVRKILQTEAAVTVPQTNNLKLSPMNSEFF